MPERERFTRQEAEEKVGQQIRTVVEFSGVPQDTTGEVTRADDSGIEEGGPERTFTVAIQWHLPREPVQMRTGEVEGEPFIFISGGKPLVDWFTKDEYEQYLVEIGEGEMESDR